MSETTTTAATSEIASTAAANPAAGAELLYAGGDSPVSAEAQAAGVAAAPTETKPEGETKADSEAVAKPVEEKPAAEAKPAEETKPEGDAKPAEALTAASYEVALPDGFEANDGLLTKFKETAAKAGLDPKSAQGFVDLFAEGMREAAGRQTAEVQGWLAQSNALPELTGTTRDTSLASLKAAFDQYGSPEANTILAQTGVGNHPAVVKMFLSMAKDLQEGRPASPGTAIARGPDGKSAGPRTPGEILYGDSLN